MAKFIKVSCKKCGGIFQRPIGRFNEAIKFNWNQYCSRKCECGYKTKRKKVICDNCEKIFEKELSQITKNNYCSSSCAAIVNNKKYPKWKNYIPPLKKCEQCGSSYKKSTSNKKYCSRKCMSEKYKRKPGDIIKIIKDRAAKLERVPTRRELDGINDSCIKTFGSWNNAVLAAGLIPNRSHENRMYRRVISKGKDGHLCDSVSEVLVDNWLAKNNILHEKDIRYPTTHHKADWQIRFNNQNVFVEYFGLANDSPRYDRAIREKEMLCKDQNIHLIKIYPKDLYPTINLSENLRNKFKNYFPALCQDGEICTLDLRFPKPAS